MRRGLVLAVAVAAAITRNAAAAGPDSVVVSIAGTRDVVVPALHVSSANRLVDLRRLAVDLQLRIEAHGDAITIRNVAGIQWTVTNGSLVVEGPTSTRLLDAPPVITGGAAYVPLPCLELIAGRRVLADGDRIFLLPETAGPTPTAGPAPAAGPAPTAAPAPTVRVPTGWERTEIRKTPEELAEMRRVDGDGRPAQLTASTIAERLPPSRDEMRYNVGLGVAKGSTGAAELYADGTAAGMRLQLSSFTTFGRDRVESRSTHFGLQDAAATWLLEAGDLVSEARGVARGARFGRATGTWRPTVSVYVPATTPLPRRATVSYRDELLLPLGLSVRGEAMASGSGFGAARWIHGRGSVDGFLRHESTPATNSRGAMASYDFFRGVTAQIGARLSSGAANERWLLGGVIVPVGHGTTLMLERTRSSLAAVGTTALGLQLPLGPVRVSQRYQWTDIAFLATPGQYQPGNRQLQSIASYSLRGRLQLSYQLATQWYESTLARQSNELRGGLAVSRRTTLQAVAEVSNVATAQRFRFGVEQRLGHGFSLNVDYGHLPAFQSSVVDTPESDRSRWLVTVHRRFVQSTPAGGSTVRGRIVDDRNQPVPGAVVNLGPYVATASSDGSYQFKHVPAGQFDLALDPAHLPAQYMTEGTQQELRLSESRDVVTADLSVVPLHAIRGHVYADRNGSGTFDRGEGVPDVVVRLDDARTATMTDADGAYAFYDLPPAAYDVWIDGERLRSDVAIAGPARLRVQLEQDGGTRTGIDLQVAPRQKPIILQEIGGR